MFDLPSHTRRIVLARKYTPLKHQKPYGHNNDDSTLHNASASIFESVSSFMRAKMCQGVTSLEGRHVVVCAHAQRGVRCACARPTLIGSLHEIDVCSLSYDIV